MVHKAEDRRQYSQTKRLHHRSPQENGQDSQNDFSHTSGQVIGSNIGPVAGARIIEEREIASTMMPDTGNVHQLLHRYGIERKGHPHLAAIDATLQFAQAPDAANEIDAFIRAQIFDT